MDIVEHNRIAWNRQSNSGSSPWCEPVDAATIAAARGDHWSVILTPTLPVPRGWFGELGGSRVLALASGGGQQVPVLAAAGARVTSFDASEEQLAKDQLVADREGLDISCERGDMADLSRFADGSFDLIFHPVSNVFAASIRPVWQECARVLNDGGRLLAGFMNPCFYLFDHEDMERGGPMQVRFALPYSDLHDLNPAARDTRIANGDAMEFSHSLDDQIGGQLDAGFVISGFYEDRWNSEATPLNDYMPTSMATLAVRQNR
jgi:SAM-dependent methyltransferase